MKALIPAAGLATRCLPASKAVPKELFPVFDRPAIQYVVEEIVDAGLDGAVFVTAAGKESVLDHFDFSPRLAMKKSMAPALQKQVDYTSSLIDVISVRQKEAKGLGHAVFSGLAAVGDEPFAVMLPDMIFLSKGKAVFSKMFDAFQQSGASVIALMEVPEEEVSKYGIVEGSIDDSGLFSISSLIEKPLPGATPSRYAIMGRYIFTPTLHSILRHDYRDGSGEMELTDAMTELIKREKLYGLIMDKDDFVFDTGDLKGYALASAFMAAQHHPDFMTQLQKLLEDIRR
ncbi:NTP transferase domain-containing protein [bacterium]|nr:NTP transferase domain-containing protein [bacterium]